MPDDTTARRDAIRRILRAREVGTQEELRVLLEQEGHACTQATLSRDLARLGARRTARASGGTAYELDDLEAARGPADESLRAVRELVLSIDDNGSLVVVVTRPGAAMAVARAIDVARLNYVLGTLAGDDTLFLAPARDVPARKVTKRLRGLFGKGDEES